MDWAAVAHPQTNDQVEHANGMILQGLKPRIFDRMNKSGRKWLQELWSVVWSFRTTPSKATGCTPFFLVYGAEAVLHTDLEYWSPKVKCYNENANQRAREDSLDQLDEARTVAFMHSARYQQALRRYQAQKIRRRDFDEGDLVLRLRQDNRGRHKLSPPWEGPYVVVKVLKPDTYKLARGRRGAHQCLEHPTAMSLLILERISKFLCFWHTQRHIWLYKCKFHHQIKSKGDSAFPRKPSAPQGLLRGVLPPKNGPIFRKKPCFKYAKYNSTSASGEFMRGASS
jgi:hypothetical protein